MFGKINKKVLNVWQIGMYQIELLWNSTAMRGEIGCFWIKKLIDQVQFYWENINNTLYQYASHNFFQQEPSNQHAKFTHFHHFTQFSQFFTSLFSTPPSQFKRHLFKQIKNIKTVFLHSSTVPSQLLLPQLILIFKRSRNFSIFIIIITPSKNTHMNVFAIEPYEDVDCNTTKMLKQDSRQTSADTDRSGYFSECVSFDHTIEQHEEVVEAISKVIELAPREMKAYEKRGNSYYELGRFREAERDYSTILEWAHNPHPLYYLKLALCHSKLSNETEAKLYYKLGIQSFSKCSISELLQNYSMTWNRVDQIRKSIEQYRKQNMVGNTDEYERVMDVLGDIEKELRKRELESTYGSCSENQKKQNSCVECEQDEQDIQGEVNQEDLEEMKKELGKMSEKFFIDQTIRNSNQYYNLLYRMMVSQFVTLMTIATSENPAIYKKQALLNKLMRAPEQLRQIQGLTRIVSAPFQIMAQMKDLTTPAFVIHLAQKLKIHTINREEQINEFIRTAVESLTFDRSFNRELEFSIEEQDSGYLVTFMEVVREGERRISTEIFESDGKKLTFVEKVLVAHMTLLTKKLFDMPVFEMKRIFKSKQLFSSMVKDSLSPSSDEPLPSFELVNEPVQKQLKKTVKAERKPAKQKGVMAFFRNLCCFRQRV